MVVSYILLVFTIAIISCSIILPFIEIQSKLLRRILKIATIVFVMWICVLHIQSKYKPDPYIPEYNPTVYVTDHGNRYHAKGCGYLWKSSNAISLYSATTKNYYPCSKCDPPLFTDETIDVINSSLRSAIPDFPMFTTSGPFVYFLVTTAILLGAICFLEQKLPFFNNGSSRPIRKAKEIMDCAVVLFLLFYLPGLIVWLSSSIWVAIILLVVPEFLWWACSRIWDKLHPESDNADE